MQIAKERRYGRILVRVFEDNTIVYDRTAAKSSQVFHIRGYMDAS